ncbi:MAG TPA: transposase [Prolixibacteraceae bacterium]|nr:transposase [Prolixibacteraceae bacterium]
MDVNPVKAVKGQVEALKQWNKTASDLLTTAVSKIRQPIESLFNWLIEKTDIQRASKVRSTKGLMVNVFSRLALTYIALIFNS